jgi:predicted tellurium resistance membrane protein TerC
MQVLTYGLASAAVLRAVMILGGAALIENFEPVLLGFAGVLLFSSFKLLSADEDEDDEDLTDNFIVKLCR